MYTLELMLQRMRGLQSRKASQALFTVGPGLLIRGLDWQSDRHTSETVHGESSIRIKPPPEVV